MRRSHGRRGFTFVETALSTVLVGGLIAGSIQVAAGISAGQTAAADAARAHALAHALLDEVLAKPYSAAANGSTPLTPVVVTPSNRLSFDEVGDYTSLVDSPARDESGKAVDAGTGWVRRVTVHWVQPSSPATRSLTETFCLRVTVTASRRGKVLAQVVGYRSRGHDVATGRTVQSGTITATGVTGAVSGVLSGVLGGGGK